MNFINKFVVQNYLNFGGNMQRLFRMTFLAVLIGLVAGGSLWAAKPQVDVSGRVAPGKVRIFTKDSTYLINNDYVIGGTLIIEPGTDIYFHPNGRLIDSTGGRIIADGLASANYTAKPDNIDPSVNWELQGQYASFDYILYNGGESTIGVSTEREVTVDTSKYNYIFHVVLDKSTGKIVDLVDAGNPAYPSDYNMPLPGNPNHVIVTYEQAIMYMAARLWKADEDVNIRTNPWKRVNDQPVDVTNGKIRFIGLPFNNFSLEWGHIVVLPGARAAFFRDVEFVNFRKELTVDRIQFYDEVRRPDWTKTVNDKMNQLTNGAGGALTTFASRTWLIKATFKDNMARLRGGALQILQAPEGFPRLYNPYDTYYDNLDLIANAGTYDLDKNPNITERDASPSMINNNIPKIDNIDNSDLEFFYFRGGDEARQAYDDARLAVFLGRFRELTFENNTAQLAKLGEDTTAGGQKIIRDLLDVPADYPVMNGNHAYGGAVYVAGTDKQVERHIEIGFGVNNSIRIKGSLVEFDDEDYFVANNNTANNYQDNYGSEGARGGAVYVGEYTSLIVAGEFKNNKATAKFFTDPMYQGTTSASYSMGGAIYTDNVIGRLQVRGNPDKAVPTTFEENWAGAGGAIYVDGNTDESNVSPIIGGYDGTFEARNYGFDIDFFKNYAIAYGGAIATKRNTLITGAGGTVEETSNYGGLYSIKIDSNYAGYAGGGIYVDIPVSYPPLPASSRAIQMIRTEFNGNVVGMDIDGDQRFDIRGGGAVYSLNGDLNVVKAVQFKGNKVYNGNGGAVAIVHPQTSSKRYFLTDLDEVTINSNLVATHYDSEDDAFTFKSDEYPPDVRMLTRFVDNKIHVDDDVLAAQSGRGTTQIGKGTLPVTEDILGVYFLDDETGYVVGYNGLIVKITDGGTNWDYQSSGTKYRLEDVEFVNYSIGYAVGDRGTIVKTVDGGATWMPLMSGTNKTIYDVDFVGTQVGYAVCEDGYILKTTDAGSTWTSMQPGTNDLYSVSFTGTNTGYAVGERGSVLVTADGGATWDFQVITGLSSDLNKVFFRSSVNGYAVGDNGVVIKTDDAGATWEFVDAGTAVQLNSVFFSGQSNGWLVGNNGVVIKTDDGGTTWTQVNPGKTWHIYDVFFTSQTNGYLGGDYGLLMRTQDAGNTWNELRPVDESHIDVVRFHPYVGLPENGVGLGGGLYVLDSVTTNRLERADSVFFNRVRFQNNESYTGSAIYSDNFDLKLIVNRSLINGNKALSEIGMEQNAVTGPVVRDGNGDINQNFASSDLVGATIYGEIQGPLPSNIYSEAANSIYGNEARFLIRLPDAPNTKGVLAGELGIGFGGTDTLRGNYWGATQADVTMQITRDDAVQGALTETFYVDYADTEDNRLNFTIQNTGDPRDQGPFESFGNYGAYDPIPLTNGADENTVGNNSIPEHLLFSGHVYDLYDKGTDIKTADYSKRRLSPIEDFAVGIPPIVKRFDMPNMPSEGKYVRRWVRDPEVAERTTDNGDLIYPGIAAIQTEFGPDADGEMYHPIGYPLYLETAVDYSGDVARNNFDNRLNNQSVFFVINETTGDFVRANLTQVDNEENRERFWSTIELVPDSTNRNPNTFLRRTFDNLANYGSGKALLERLSRDPYPNEPSADNPWAAYNEDKSALRGRKYDDDDNLLGGVSDLFSNRPGMPADNQDGAKSRTTFFAGEKYNALPVRVGDVVRVVSRTVLWREGVDAAYDDGLSFEIRKSTEPPVFTYDIVDLQTDTIVKIVPSEFPNKDLDTVVITEFLNRVFVTEDRDYPNEIGKYSSLPIYGDDDPFSDTYGGRGRDFILSVTADDNNRWYDPRAEVDPDNYSWLTYSWEVNGASAAKRWLFVDTIHVNGESYYKGNDGKPSSSLIEFKGHPINPFIVPGGEKVKVSVSNFPPTWRNVDNLKDMNIPQDTIDKWVETFPGYMNTGKDRDLYYEALARYLQQDTINVGSMYTREYEFDLHVVNTPPKFLDDEFVEEVVYYPGTQDVYVTYSPSVYKCGKTDDGRLIASMTWQAASDDLAKLRFQADFNSTDELEDQSPAAAGWDFRYGRTHYAFANTSIRPGTDTTVTDSIDYDEDPYSPGGRMVSQARPVWMSNDYFFEYDSDNTQDEFLADFMTFGKMNIRIPYMTAYDMIKPVDGDEGWYNRHLNTDTVFTMIINDGHGAMTSVRIPIFINVQPMIENDNSLPVAFEDEDYNPQLLDQSKAIHVYDPNFDQSLTYRLIYPSTTEMSIPYDACYPEAGELDLTTLKTTPEWLKINERSGILYGKPGVKDAPKNERVTVVVIDENGLMTYKVLDLEVRPNNHRPFTIESPEVICVDRGSYYEQNVTVGDLDLLRETDEEILTVELLNYDNEPLTGLNVEPSEIKGNNYDTDTVSVKLYTDNFDLPLDQGANHITVKVVVTDKAGLADTLVYRLQMSLETDFVAGIEVANNNRQGKYASQMLYFGTSSQQVTTTGDGIDGADVGSIDEVLCENEIPPLPEKDVFDARWTIPLRNGILRNIYPSQNASINEFSYIAKYQAGGEDGSSSPEFPIVISWRPDEIPAPGISDENPNGSQWYLRDIYSNGNFFSINMHNPDPNLVDGNTITRWRDENNKEWYEVVVNNTIIDGFVIVYDVNNSVNTHTNMDVTQTGITNVAPNPVNSNSKINFEVLKAGHVKIQIVDALGNVVNNLVDEQLGHGAYSIDWNGTDGNNNELVSGAYQVRMISGSEQSNYPVVIVK
jgi:photosystem II stability/assembly factor-like uncharacterized protein